MRDMASPARHAIDKGSQKTPSTQTVRDVTYQLLRELGLTTVFGGVECGRSS